MPGVNVRTATRSGPVNPVVPPAGRYFVAGLFAKGRTDVAQQVRSLAELEVLYGTRQAYSAAYDDLRTFFEEGGTDAYVIRVVGANATKGSLLLKDGSTGAGLSTIRVDAISGGAWSSAIGVSVSAGTTGGVKVSVHDGSGGTAGKTETYDNLATVADVATALNGSSFVRAVNLGSATAAPSNLPRTVASSLSAGTDDRVTVNGAAMAAAFDLFGPDLGPGVLAAPGFPIASFYDDGGIGAAVSSRRLLLAAMPIASDDYDYTQMADQLLQDYGDAGEFVGLFGPWVRIPIGGGATKLISPEGYVAACRARAIREGGPWIAPAGERSIARFVLGTERELTRAQGDAWDEAHISAIRTIAGTTRLYGWRSLSTDEENYALLTGRDVLNVVAFTADAQLERYVFDTIDSDGRLYASVAGELIGILDPMRLAGGLYARYAEDGTQIDPGYSVDVGPTVNTLAVIQANTVAAVVALRVSPVGTLIDVTIVKAGLTASV